MLIFKFAITYYKNNKNSNTHGKIQIYKKISIKNLHFHFVQLSPSAFLCSPLLGTMLTKKKFVTK